MISLADLLRRLRRTWAPPGAAVARVAPPTDVTERLQEEIRPLLQAIQALQEEEQAIREKAEEAAAALLDSASRAAGERAREAERAAPTHRSEAAKRKHTEVDEEIAGIQSASEEETRRIQESSSSRTPEFAARLAACVLAAAEETR